MHEPAPPLGGFWTAGPLGSVWIFLGDFLEFIYFFLGSRCRWLFWLLLCLLTNIDLTLQHLLRTHTHTHTSSCCDAWFLNDSPASRVAHWLTRGRCCSLASRLQSCHGDAAFSSSSTFSFWLLTLTLLSLSFCRSFKAVLWTNGWLAAA